MLLSYAYILAVVHSLEALVVASPVGLHSRTDDGNAADALEGAVHGVGVTVPSVVRDTLPSFDIPELHLDEFGDVDWSSFNASALDFGDTDPQAENTDVSASANGGHPGLAARDGPFREIWPFVRFKYQAKGLRLRPAGGYWEKAPGAGWASQAVMKQDHSVNHWFWLEITGGLRLCNIHGAVDSGEETIFKLYNHPERFITPCGNNRGVIMSCGTSLKC